MVSETFRNRQADPLKTAVFWVEFVMKIGKNELVLRPYGSELNFLQYNSLDIIFPAICLFILTSYIGTVVTKFVLTRMSRPKQIKID